MNLLVLIIESDDPKNGGVEDARQLEQQVRSLGASTSRVTAAEMNGFMKKAITAGEEPLVVLFGPTLTNPLTLARQLRAFWNNGHLVFVPEPSRLDALRGQLSRAPMIGSHWSLAASGTKMVPRQIFDALRTVEKRVRLRTTLDRANVQISAPKVVDSSEYRRMVLSDHYLVNLLTQAQDAIISLDTANRIVYWSSGATKKFGLTAENASGMQISDTPLWSQRMQKYLGRIATSIQPLTAEIAFGTTGAAFSMEAVFSAVRDDRSAFIGVSLMMRDVTERKRQLELERQAREQAEQVSRLKDEFLAMLSHELRTPLNSILGWAQLLQSISVSEERLKSGLETIERNALHQAKLIDDLLDISSVISGKLVLELAPVRLGVLVQNAATALRPQVDSKRLKLSLLLDAKHDLVNGDADRLQQVIWNLLSNAIKFTPEGGAISLSLRDSGAYVHLVVSDTGQGIDQEFLPRIFSRFQQADSSIKRRTGGVGLGLAIVKQLVDMHKGVVSAKSPGPGFGSTFTVTLPVWGADGPAPRPHQPSRQRTPSSLNGMRILIVDDEADARQMLAFLLEENGAKTTMAASAAEALQVIDEFAPDLLISDIGMPGIDGYELLRAIRARSSTYRGLPAIALTAFAGFSNKSKARAAGYQHHIVKPFQTAELLSIVANVGTTSTVKQGPE